MATYYIDPSQGVNGTGTLLSPYNTWTGVTFVAGNSYLQKRGTTWVAPAPVSGHTNSYTCIMISSIVTTPNTPIIIGAYSNPDGTDDTNLAKPVIDVNFNEIGVRANNTPYVTIKELEICNASHSGIYLNGSSASPLVPGYCQVLTCKVRDSFLFPGNVSGIDISSVVLGNPTVINFASTHNCNSRLIGFVGVSGTLGTTLNNTQRQSTVTSATQLTIAVDSTALTYSGGGRIEVESDGIYPYSGRNHVIENCEVDNVSSDGIWAQSDGIHITGCKVSRVGKGLMGTGDCIQLTGTTNDFYVANNVLDHSDEFCKQAFILSGSQTGYGGLFENNVIYDPDCSGTAKGLSSGYGSYYSDQPGTVCRNNTIYGGARIALGVWASNQLITGNKVYINRPGCSSGIFVTAQNCNISGNLIIIESPLYADANAAILLDAANLVCSGNTVINKYLDQKTNVTGICSYNSPRPNIKYVNNIVIGFPVAIRKNVSQNSYDGFNLLFDNLLSTVDTSFVTIPNSNLNFIVDPLLDPTTYKPLPGSPCIGAGTFVGYYSDATGRPYSIPPSIGAYEDYSVKQDEYTE